MEDDDFKGPEPEAPQQNFGGADSDEEQDQENADEVVPVEQQPKRSPLLDLADQLFLLKNAQGVAPERLAAARAAVFRAIEEHNMAPFYQRVCAELQQPLDAALLERLKQANAAQLAKFEAQIKEATDKAGESEVRDGYFARAEYLARIGEKEAALKAYEETLEKTIGAGSKIDLIFSVIRLAFFHGDSQLLASHLSKVKTMIETGGGDWERRNLLKVYEALYLIMKRDFVQASQRLLDTVATFTCYELLDYNTFIFYTVLLSAVTLDRPTLNKKVIRSPEILTAYHDVPHIQLFIESLYKCRYADFYRALLDLTPTMKQDRYLAPHVSYFLREVRIVAYRQFLESYKSVTLQSMAKAFNVSPAFLDEDLSRFIASGRVPCKIDKVNGVIESNHPDTKNAQYRSVLVEGDLLLSRIQKLAKIVSY